MLDENVLTIGFARRVPSYKRLTLMLNDPVQLSQLLNDPSQPMQIVVAGKAHPADEGGKGLIQQMVRFTDSPDVRRRIVFLPDYDMAMAHALVQGCDVWLNNPLRPLEACGTSGMKAALNGGLNVSVRDGWWDEWYDGGNGWEIPSADGVADPARGATSSRPARCTSCSASRWRRCSTSGTPTGSRRAGSSGSGTRSARSGRRCRPSGWSGSTSPTLYVPAAAASRTWPTPRTGSGPRASWPPGSSAWCEAWPQVRIEHVETEAAGQALGSALTVRVSVALGELTPDDVMVEVVYGRPDDDRRDRLAGLRRASGRGEFRPPRLTPPRPSATALPRLAPPRLGTGLGLVRYSGEVPLDQPGPFGYTVRVLPNHPLLDSRAELGLVTYPQAPAGMTNGDLR